MLKQKTLKRLWPKAPASTISEIVRVAPEVFAEFGIDDKLVVAHLMAQISHECGAGTIGQENMSYSAARMMVIFGVGKHSAKITEEEAATLAHKPQKLAERVYGIGNPKKAKELGNTRPGDGWKYRGNGFLQLTGGANYKRIGELIGEDLYNNPAMLSDPALSFRVAVAEFVKLNCVKPALEDNGLLVTKRVNGGTNGLAMREVWLERWKLALTADEGVVDDAIPPPEEPRAGEKDATPPVAKSKTLWGVVTSVLTSMGLAVWEAIKTNPDKTIIVCVTIVAALVIFVGRKRIKELIDEATS